MFKSTAASTTKAQASKTYVDAIGKEWPIRLNEIAVDTANRTFGRGVVRAGDEIFLSPEFAFQWTGPSRSWKKGPRIRRVGPKCSLNATILTNEWVEFVGVINPQDVAIPIDSYRDRNGQVSPWRRMDLQRRRHQDDVSCVLHQEARSLGPFLPSCREVFLRYDKRKGPICGDQRCQTEEQHAARDHDIHVPRQL